MLLLLTIIFPSIICIDQKIKDLVKEALATRSKYESLSFSGEKRVMKGYNIQGGLRLFSAYNVITGDLPEIHAAKHDNDMKLTAIEQTSDIYDSDSIYKDYDTGEYFKLKYYKTLDGVNLYNTTKKDPTDVFIHFIYSLVPQFPNFTCLKERSGHRCSINYFLNWDKKEDMAILYEKSPFKYISPVKGLLPDNFRVGGMYGVSVYFACDYSRTKFTFDYDIGFQARFGFGFEINDELEFDTDLFNQDIPLYAIPPIGYGKGLSLELGLYLYVTLKIDEFKVKLPKALSYYKEYRVKVGNSGGYNRKFNIGKFVHEIQPITKNNLTIDDVHDFLSNTKVKIVPAAELGLRLTLQAFNLIDISFDVGIQFRVTFNFTGNFKKCTCPYLYGTFAISLMPLLRFSGLKLLGFTLIDEMTYKIFELPLLQFPPMCLFSSRKSIEGDQKIKVNSTGSFAFSIKEAKCNDTFIFMSINLMVFNATAKLAETTIYFDPPNGGVQKVNQPKKRLLLTDISKDTSFMYFANLKNVNTGDEISVISDNFNFKIDKDKCLPISSNHKNLCLKLSLKDADYVDVFKEFSLSSETKMLSFNPYVPNGSELGMIMHGKDNESYAAPLIGNIYYDDTKESNGKLNVKTEVKIGINSLLHEYDGLLNCKVSFYVDSIGEDNPIMTIDIPKPQKGVNLTSTFLRIADKIFNFEMKSSSSKIIVKTQLKFSNKEIDFKDTILRSDLKNDPYFTIKFSHESLKLELSVNRIVPNVFVSLKKIVNDEKLGIISTVYTASEQWNGEKLNVNVSMQESEKYGIIVFNIPYELSDNHKIGCVIQGAKIVPLVSHVTLTSNMYFILLEKNATLFNQNSIHIPFRRQGYQDKDFVISLVSIFATSNNTYCSEGFEVNTKMSDVGCFDVINLSKKTILNYIGLDEKGKSLKLEKISDENNNLTLILFNNDNADHIKSSNISIVPNVHKLPSNHQSFFINKEIIKTLRRLNKNISIVCKRCDNIRTEYVEISKPVTEYQSQKISGDHFNKNVVKNGDSFSFVPEKDQTLLVTATCNNSYNAFCEYNITFGNGIFLMIHNSSNGVKDLIHEDINLRIEPGVSSQVLNNSYNTTIVKEYKGDHILKELAPSDAKLVLHYYLNNTVKMKLKFGDDHIPFSMSKFCNSSGKFMKLLGIKKNDNDNFKISGVLYSSDGNIITKKSMLEPKNINLSKLDLLTDLPESYFKSSSIQIKYEKWKFSPLLIIGIIFGAVIIISVSVYILIRRKNDDITL